MKDLCLYIIPYGVTQQLLARYTPYSAWPHVLPDDNADVSELLVR